MLLQEDAATHEQTSGTQQKDTAGEKMKPLLKQVLDLLYREAWDAPPCFVQKFRAEVPSAQILAAGAETWVTSFNRFATPFRDRCPHPHVKRLGEAQVSALWGLAAPATALFRQTTKWGWRKAVSQAALD